MKKLTLLSLLLGFAFGVVAADTKAPDWLSRPLSLADCANIALAQNAAILKAKDDLQASQGVVIQTRAVALPHLQAAGKYTDEQSSLVQTFPGATDQPHQSWNAGIQLVQNIYAGGKMVAGFQGATATRKQALAQYQTAVADTLLLVRLAYYDVLLAEQQIVVNEASVKLLQKELDDQQRRFDAGTVPHFNVLRAEVAVANAKPNLIHARSQFRIAKNVLVNLLGYDLPREVLEDIPMQLTDNFEVAPWNLILPDAIQQALERRTELKALRQDIKLQEVNVVNAKAGYKPTIAAFAGYNWMNNSFSTDLSDELDGWVVGGQLTWDIFDGALTVGKVKQAKALYSKSQTELADRSRQIELNVRTSYSDFIEAREVLDSQNKVQEQAEESLREAKARFDAGTGTQLDVLDAETSLTQARTTLVTAQHDYAAARARLERAIGAELATVK
ncbi:MAG TPA: TolC family protein [bacterium]|nr:TolC family protein [bacterium]